MSSQSGKPGHLVIMMLSSVCGSLCHNSSVIKGINGCKASKQVLKTYSKTGWASALLFLVDSMYLSANSCQINSYKASEASWNLYESIALVTISMVLFSCFNIHSSSLFFAA